MTLFLCYLQGTSLDGHALKLKFCENKRRDTAGKVSDKVKASKKLHVKNVAFEATEKELRQLFSPFGQVTLIEEVVCKQDGLGLLLSEEA